MTGIPGYTSPALRAGAEMLGKIAGFKHSFESILDREASDLVALGGKVIRDLCREIHELHHELETERAKSRAAARNAGVEDEGSAQ